jgi:hypothetical protein
LFPDVSTGFVIVSKEDCDMSIAGTDRQEMFSKLEKDLIEQVSETNLARTQ